MHDIFIKGDIVLNSDNKEHIEQLLNSGWIKLDKSKIVELGMSGYEHIVSPVNTKVLQDGSIFFTPPAAPSDRELFQQLRTERDRRLAATDYLLMPDYPISDDQRAVVQAYRQALRDLPAQEGAPWDGGREETPWPELPAGLKA